MIETIGILGSIGEFVGALLIAATLIYLAIQTSATSKNVEILKDQNITTTIARFNEKIAESEEIAAVWIKGREGRELSPTEELRFNSLWVLWIHIPRILWNAGEEDRLVYQGWVQSLLYSGLKAKYDRSPIPTDLREMLDSIYAELTETEA